MRLLIFFLLLTAGFNALAKQDCETTVTNEPLALVMGEILMKQQVPEMVIGRHNLEATGRVYAAHSPFVVLNRTAKVTIEANRTTKLLQISVQFSSKVRRPLNADSVREKEYLRRDSLRVAAAMKEYIDWLNNHREENSNNRMELSPALLTQLKDGHPQWEMNLVYHQSKDETETEALHFVATLISGVWHMHHAD